MQDVVVSINKNLLRITTLQNDALSSLSADISKDVVEDSKILNPQALADVLSDLFQQMQLNPKKIALTFVLEPEQMTLRFVTINKGSTDIEGDIRAKVTDANLENSFYSYEKIGPYVYQFEAVEKYIFENLIAVSDIVNVPIKAIIGWPAALPRYAETNDAAIFIFGSNGSQVVVLSELGGVFFTGEYGQDTSSADIDKIVKELSVYKRTKPITNIYALNFDSSTISSEFTFHKIELGVSTDDSVKGYETNLLIHFILDQKSELLSTQLNLVNLLPVPAAAPANVALAKYSKVGAMVLVPVLLISLGFIGVTRLGSKTRGDTVLSSSDQAQETSQSTESVKPAEAPKPELKKQDLVLRIENGSGINGMAAKTKALLEEKGYKVLEIDTAKENVDKTKLNVKSSKADYVALLSEDLKEGFGEVTVEQNVSDSEKYDLLITIGSNVSL